MFLLTGFAGAAWRQRRCPGKAADRLWASRREVKQSLAIRHAREPKLDAPLVTVRAVRDGGRSVVVAITGELDAITAPAFPASVIQALSALDGRGEQVTLDLSGLAFLDAAGARALIAAVQAIPHGHAVAIRSMGPIVSRVLDLLGRELPTVRG